MLFMVQATYTAEAWRAMIERPQDRKETIDALVAKAGGRLLDLWFCQGESDIVFVFEAPDVVTAAAMTTAGNASGHIKSITTTTLLTVEESLEVMRRAGDLGPRHAPTS